MRFPLQIPFASYFIVLKALSPDRILMRSIVVKAFFWFLAALLQLVLVQFAQNTLHGDSRMVSLMQAAIALGIGGGSFAAGLAARGRTPYHFIRPGAIAMALSAAAMAYFGTRLPLAMAGVIVMGAAGGFFFLPTGIATQERPARDMLGRCLATSNFLDCAAMILSSAMLWLLGKCGFSAPHIIAAAAFCILLFLPWTNFKDATAQQLDGEAAK
jgi:acyl-[acyl-carrier-protein]-phospholipid O-acyltransferase/long-chain-fatty-acid--[acyl-carrier-protein] ligase